MIIVGFYDLSKDDRSKVVKKIYSDILESVKQEYNTDQIKEVTVSESILIYASDKDTYIRKNAYNSFGKIYNDYADLRQNILMILSKMMDNPDYKVRQTAVYALGEIGKKDVDSMIEIFERAFEDEHHAVRNAVMGSMKQMGQKNPKPTFKLARKYLHHKNPQIRKEMIHGIELRGRTHPEDVLPILKEMENDENKEVRRMVIHVAGQISYKKGCLEKVVNNLKNWENKELVAEIVDEIVDVHKQYSFAVRSAEDAENYIKLNL